MNDAAIEKMRQEFEAAYEAKTLELGIKFDRIVLVRGADGLYALSGVQVAWWGWQASRAALVITLPSRINVPDEDDYDGDYEQYEADEHAACMANRMLGNCAAAVKAAGVEVVHG